MTDSHAAPGRRSLWLYLSARSVSIFGDAVTTTAMAFAFFARFGTGDGATWLGLALLIRGAVQVIMALWGGVIADRFSRSKVMVLSSLLAAAGQLLLALSFEMKSAALACILASAAIVGACDAAFLPASSAVLPQIVSPDHLQRANSYVRLGQNVASIGGAATGGLLVVGLGAHQALLVDAASFALCGLLVLLLRVPAGHPRTVAADRQERMFASLSEGWRAVVARRWLWVTVVGFSVINGCMAATLRILGPAHFSSGSGPRAWSFIVATMGIGLFAGSVVAMKLRVRHGLVIGVLCVSTFALVPLALAMNFPSAVCAVLAAISGIGIDIFAVMWAVTMQTEIPSNLLGRVSSFDALGSLLAIPIVTALAGPLSAQIGARSSLLMFAGLIVVAAAAMAATPAIRSMTIDRPQTSRGFADSATSNA